MIFVFAIIYADPNNYKTYCPYTAQKTDRIPKPKYLTLIYKCLKTIIFL